jgi:hypothetical protein
LLAPLVLARIVGIELQGRLGVPVVCFHLVVYLEHFLVVEDHLVRIHLVHLLRMGHWLRRLRQCVLVSIGIPHVHIGAALIAGALKVLVFQELLLLQL